MLALFNVVAIIPLAFSPAAAQQQAFTPDDLRDPIVAFDTRPSNPDPIDRSVFGQGKTTASYFRSLLNTAEDSRADATQHPEEGGRVVEHRGETPNAPLKRKPGLDDEKPAPSDDFPSGPVTSTPEPAMLALLGTGMAVIIAGKRFKRGRRAD
jgi:hypothetical protein